MGEMIQPLLALMLLLAGLEAGPSATPYPGAILLSLLAYHGSGLLLARQAARARLAIWRSGAEASVRDPSALIELFLWGMLVLWSGWPTWIREATGDLAVVSIFLALAPFVLQRALRAMVIWPYERLMRLRRWSRRDAMLFQVRMLGLVLAPVLCLTGAMDAFERIPLLASWEQAWPRLVSLGSMIFFVTVLLGASPWLVRFILGARPLERGPLRDRLEAYNERNAFRVNEILVWNTGGAVSNALYIGLWKGLRYIVLTDALMAKLPPRAVEAVYAHEAGHGVRGHLAWRGVMIIGFATLSVALAVEIPFWTDLLLEGHLDRETRMNLGGGFAAVTSLGLLLLFFLGGAGWLSRRFETEADLHAVKTSSNPGDFQVAITRVGALAGVLHSKKSGFMHFGIGKRIGLINRYVHERGFRIAFDRLLRRCRLVLLGFAAVGIGLTLWQLPGEFALGEARLALMEGYEREKAVAGEAAAAHFDRAYDLAIAAMAYPRQRRDAERQAIWALTYRIDLALKTGEYHHARQAQEAFQHLSVAGREVEGFNRRLLAISIDVLDRRTVPLESLAGLEKAFEKIVKRYGQLENDDDVRGDLWILRRAIEGRHDRYRSRLEKLPASVRVLAAWDREEEPSEALLLAAAKELEGHRYRFDLFERFHPGRLAEALPD